MVSQTPRSRLAQCKIVPVNFTDHHLVTAELIVSPGVRVWSHWCFNNKLLLDSTFCEYFRCFWQRWRLKKPKFGELKLWWEVGKAHFQVFCQTYTSSSTVKLRIAVEELEANIKDIETGVNTVTPPLVTCSRRRGWS